MADNPFDQFDAPAADANPFDAFDGDSQSSAPSLLDRAKAIPLVVQQLGPYELARQGFGGGAKALSPEESDALVGDDIARIESRIAKSKRVLAELAGRGDSHRVEMMRRDAQRAIAAWEKELSEAQGVMRGAAPGPTRGVVGDSVSRATRSALQVLPDVLRTGGSITTAFTGKAPEDTRGHALATRIEGKLDKDFPGDAYRDGKPVAQVAEGLGSTAPYAVTGLAGAPRAALALGVSQGSSSQTADAIANDATPAEQKFAALLGASLGATEAIPFNRLFGRLRRLDSATGGRASQIVSQSTATGAEEMLQELTQTFGSNVVARALYDEDRALGEGLEDAATTGGIVGGILGGVGGAAARRRAPEGPSQLSGVNDAIAAAAERGRDANPFDQFDDVVSGDVEAAPGNVYTPQGQTFAAPQVSLSAQGPNPFDQFDAEDATVATPPQAPIPRTDDAEPGEPTAADRADEAEKAVIDELIAEEIEADAALSGITVDAMLPTPADWQAKAEEIASRIASSAEWRSVVEDKTHRALDGDPDALEAYGQLLGGAPNAAPSGQPETVSTRQIPETEHPARGDPSFAKRISDGVGPIVSRKGDIALELVSDSYADVLSEEGLVGYYVYSGPKHVMTVTGSLQGDNFDVALIQSAGDVELDNSSHYNTVGPTVIRQTLRAFQQIHPNVVSLSGNRVGGARQAGGYVEAEEGTRVNVGIKNTFPPPRPERVMHPRQDTTFRVESLTPPDTDGERPYWDFEDVRADGLDALLGSLERDGKPARVAVTIRQYIRPEAARRIAERAQSGERAPATEIFRIGRDLTDDVPQADRINRPGPDGRFGVLIADRDGVVQFDPRDIVVDAERFQFKTGGDSEGVLDTLQNIDEWDPSSGSGLLFWIGNDGRAYVADGHQRTGLAKRLIAAGKSKDIVLRGEVLRESDGVSARMAKAMGALKNVESASPYDLADVLVDYPGGLDSPRINKSRPSFRQARDIANISRDARGYAKNADIPANYAAIVGQVAKDAPERHMDLLQMLAEDPPANLAEADFMVRAAMAGPTVEATQTDMFGATVATRGLMREKREIATRAAKDLRSLARQLGQAARDPDALGQVEGNVIDAGASQKAADDARFVEFVINKLSVQAGNPVNAALNAAAERYAGGGTREAAVREFVAAVRAAASQPGGIRNLIEDSERDDGQDRGRGRQEDAPTQIGGSTGALFRRQVARPDTLKSAISPGQSGDSPGSWPTGEKPGRKRQPERTPEGEAVGALHDKAVSLREASEKLRRLLKITVRQGRMGRVPKEAVGFYKLTDGVIRMRKSFLTDFDTFAHEAAHALEFGPRTPKGFRALLASFAPSLEPLAYEGADPRVAREEGFAEWFRFYLTNPPYAQSVAPDFTAAFEAFWGRENASIANGLLDVRRAYADFVEAPSAASVAASVVTDGGRGKIERALTEVEEMGGPLATAKVLASRVYTTLLDKQHPFTRTVGALKKLHRLKTGTSLQLDAARDPAKLLRLALDSTSAGHMDIMHGVHGYRSTEAEGPALAEAIELALGDKAKWTEQDLTDFGAYLVSRRAVHEWHRYWDGDIPNPPTLHTIGDHQNAIADFEARHPTWQRAASLVHAWSRRHWRKKLDAGLITQKQHDEGLAIQDYVPFQRVVTDKDVATSVKGLSKDGSRAGGVKRFRGSDRDIVNPLESLMQDAYLTARVIARNDVLKALTDLAEDVGDAGRLVEVLPATELQGTTVDALEALNSALSKSAMDEDTRRNVVDTLADALNGESMATVFRATATDARGEPVVFMWRDGKRIPLRIGDRRFAQEIYDVFTTLNEETAMLAVQTLGVPATILRYGITTHPSFVISNLVRDQAAAWILNDVGYKPFWDAARGMKSELAMDDRSRVYNIVGGISGGGNVAALDDAKTNRDLATLRRKGIKTRRFKSWKGFARLSDVSETATRLGLFDRYFQDAKERGLSDYDAAVEAAYEARDYIDFGRHGSRMTAARRLVPFFNASIQALDKTVRVLAGDPLRVALPYLKHKYGKAEDPASLTEADRRTLRRGAMAWFRMGQLAALSAALRALYLGDEEYEEISDYLRSTHWAVKVDGVWYFVPKPFELGTFSNFAERAVEAFAQDDPKAMERFRASLQYNFIPPSEITALQLQKELWANKKTFNDAPIVNYWDLGLDPHLQYNAYTSALGVKLGELLGVSPARVDHVIQGVTGSLGRDALEVSNMVAGDRPARDITTTPIVRRFAKNPFNGSLSKTHMYETVGRTGEWSQAAASLKHYLDRNQEAALEYLGKLEGNKKTWAYVDAFASELADRAGLDSAAEVKRLHPMRRAYDAQSAAGAIRKELLNNDLRDADNQRLPLPPRERRDAMTILGEYQTAVARNGLIIVDEPGWAGKSQIDEIALVRRLATVSPAAFAELDRRQTEKKVEPPSDVEPNWRRLNAMLGRPPTPK